MARVNDETVISAANIHPSGLPFGPAPTSPREAGGALSAQSGTLGTEFEEQLKFHNHCHAGLAVARR